MHKSINWIDNWRFNMVSTFVQNWIVFIILFMMFLPFLSKVVRLASRTWDEREYLERERVRQIVFLTPTIVIIVFLVIYIGVVALLKILEF